MEGIYTEFDNENSLRMYPFSAGCVPAGDNAIPFDVFIDAALYPVNPSGNIYLSEVSENGVFSISDSNGVIMTGSPSGNQVELYDVSDLRRHVGVLVASSEDKLSEYAGRGASRTYGPESTTFAAQCVFPIVIDGVSALSVGGSPKSAGLVGFSNGADDSIRVSSGLKNGRSTLRFDVIPRPVVKDSGSIRRIICVVDGQTPFRISRMYYPNHPERGGYNTVILSLYGIDKESVCAAAHRGNQLEMADTCECDKQALPSEENLPETYKLIEVFIPPDEDPSRPEGGLADGAENAFYLAVPNLSGYDNPLSITLENGVVSPKTDDLKTVTNGNSVELAEGEMLDKVTSNGVILQVPGLSGGAI